MGCLWFARFHCKSLGAPVELVMETQIGAVCFDSVCKSANEKAPNDTLLLHGENSYSHNKMSLVKKAKSLFVVFEQNDQCCYFVVSAPSSILQNLARMSEYNIICICSTAGLFN